MKQISFLLLHILVPLFLSGQDLNGRWTGRDSHELNGRMFTFNKETIIKQDGNKLSGKTLVVEEGTKNHFVIQFSGTVKNGKVKLILDKVLKVDYPQTTWSILCFRNFKGELIVDEIKNMLILDLKNYGTDLIYDLKSKTYSEGICHPTFTKLTKKYRDNENQSLIVEDSSKQTNANKSQIILIDKKEIKLFTKSVKIKVWDRFEEDADIINLYLNGKIIFPNLKVTKKGELLEIELIPGINIIEVEALNEGNVSPNTSSVSIFTDIQQYDISLSAKKGERDSLKIILD